MVCCVATVHEMDLVGDDGSQIDFSAYGSGVAELATIVEELNLSQALKLSLSTQANLTLLAGMECVNARWGEERAVLSLSDGKQIEARLVVAADGAESALRSAAGIAVQIQEYGHTGVV